MVPEFALYICIYFAPDPRNFVLILHSVSPETIVYFFPAVEEEAAFLTVSPEKNRRNGYAFNDNAKVGFQCAIIAVSGVLTV